MYSITELFVILIIIGIKAILNLIAIGGILLTIIVIINSVFKINIVKLIRKELKNIEKKLNKILYV